MIVVPIDLFSKNIEFYIEQLVNNDVIEIILKNNTSVTIAKQEPFIPSAKVGGGMSFVEKSKYLNSFYELY